MFKEFDFVIDFSQPNSIMATDRRHYVDQLDRLECR